jgi:hypothetical protein
VKLDRLGIEQEVRHLWPPVVLSMLQIRVRGHESHTTYFRLYVTYLRSPLSSEARCSAANRVELPECYRKLDILFSFYRGAKSQGLVFALVNGLGGRHQSRFSLTDPFNEPSAHRSVNANWSSWTSIQPHRKINELATPHSLTAATPVLNGGCRSY